MQPHELYMRRCIQLAKSGAGSVAPNPMVGSVLVHEERIIGEGFHRQYGHAHAEVNCLDSVRELDKKLIASSTLYVSLEPCAHYGKTPPCADLIIQHNIPKVVIGCRDPFDMVNGKGVEKLEKAGIEVMQGVLEKECIHLNRRFFTFHTQKRAYIILKWAQTKNGVIGTLDGSQINISNQFSNRLVHKWRSHEAGILVGKNTALNDDPQLNNRLWNGNSPIRMVIDGDLTLPVDLKLFDGTNRTIVFNYQKSESNGQVDFYKLDKDEPVPVQIAKACYQMNIISLLVEGGAQLLQSFIDLKLWDEARIIENETLIIDKGVGAPVLFQYEQIGSEQHLNDKINYYRPIH